MHSQPPGERELRVVPGGAGVGAAGLGVVEGRSAACGFICALKGNRSVWCWGDNGFGQSGAPTLEFLKTNEPHRVEGLENPTAVAAGYCHTCAVEEHGTVSCWGDNHFAQFGTGATGPGSATPVRSDMTGVVKISAAWYRTIAVRQDSTAWSWGSFAYAILPTTQVSELLGGCAVD